MAQQLIVQQISTNHTTSICSTDRADLLRQGKWYLSLKENGVKKYRVIITKIK